MSVPQQVSISISKLGVSVGIAVASITYKISSTAGAATAVTTEKGIKLIGKATAFGTSLFVNDIAGSTIDLVSTQFAEHAKLSVQASSQVAALTTAAAAGVGAAIAVTAVGAVAQQAAAGVLYLSSAACDKILECYANCKVDNNIKFNGYLIGDEIYIDDEDEPDYVLIQEPPQGPHTF